MNKSKLIVLSIAAFSSVNAANLEMQTESVLIPSRLSGTSLSFNEGSFYVNQGSQKTKVENYNLDASLRGISDDNLEKFLKHGYLTLNQNSDEEYTLRSNLRLAGGGPWTALAVGIGFAGVMMGAAITGNLPLATAAALSAKGAVLAAALSPTP